MKKSSLWQQLKARVVAKDMNESLETSSALRKPIELGSFVIHTVSGCRGVVRAIENFNGHDVITFEDQSTGRMVRKVNRHECRLATTERYAR